VHSKSYPYLRGISSTANKMQSTMKHNLVKQYRFVTGQADIPMEHTESCVNLPLRVRRSPRSRGGMDTRLSDFERWWVVSKISGTIINFIHSNFLIYSKNRVHHSMCICVLIYRVINFELIDIYKILNERHAKNRPLHYYYHHNWGGGRKKRLYVKNKGIIVRLDRIRGF
jgi:hypothetical protein